MIKNISLALFHDKESIIMQDRKSRSKYGERYGFWGGSTEEGETPIEAIKRELIEELNYKPSKLTYWQDYSFNVSDDNITLHLFLSPITPELLKSQVTEGDGMVRFSFGEVLASEKFDKIDKTIVSLLILHLKMQSWLSLLDSHTQQYLKQI